MIRRLGGSNSIYQWMAFHAILGILTSISRWFIIGWFIYISVQSFARILATKDRHADAMYLLAYIVGMEILFRMAKTSPFVPYEIGKYGPILFISTALVVARNTSRTATGFIIILLLLPSLSIYYGHKYIDDVAFNFAGMACLGLCIQYFAYRIIRKEDFIRIVRTLLMPVISILSYLIVKTPSFEEIDFKLGAIFSTTGGFGSNQVSTVLGMAMFLLTICYFNKFTIFRKRVIDLIILGFIFARALLTFSRGGVIVAVLGLLIYMFMTKPSGYRLPGFKAGQVVLFVILITASALFVNKLTGDALLLRYQGETMTTLSGEKEKNIDVITTGRYALFVSEVKLFLKYPFLGVGPGGAMYLRVEEHKNTASHSEFSRLLAENGIFGLIIILILLIYPLYRFSQQKPDPGKLVTFCLVLVALGMTFHAAMRTFVTPFMYGLGMSSIYFLKHDP